MFCILPHLFFILFFYANCVHSQTPIISFISKQRVVNLGDTLELVCQVQHASQYSVNWVLLKNDDPSNFLFITKGQRVILSGNRYSVRFDDKLRSYILTIHSVQEVDAGTYHCQIITGSNSKVDAEVNVIVRIPPVISDNSTRNVLTTVGSNIELSCFASGFPMPNISWRREKYELMPNDKGALLRGNTIKFYNVTKKDRGTYYCVADNGVEPGARRPVSVEIEFPPVIKVGRQRYGQALQFYADLQCDVEAFPSPSIHWFKDGEQLTDDQYFKISIFSRSDEFSRTTLRIKRIENKHYGLYYCQAANKLGSNSEAVELYETVNVICPPACDVQTGSHSISLKPVLNFRIFLSFFTSIFLLTLNH
ncbi:lachesin-like isoform X2 [Dinothrombium tinctorium]|uniref:Lachesin-like isoform X2 n=1 Tax=Dinothrombium tinctorium TaxID=1965070 RepID=A0A3S3NUX9_9ACAR|nr:lachesin-like isoform X2 [Dinothrombium tinctorium]RWS06547.1 lachesin-like isoform X2 [Dinothrombium tinctorium]RWS09999.1 lachesin-like isoform X2 [Dinothrombium tinctorium]